jgi:hypothetical protein
VTPTALGPEESDDDGRPDRLLEYGRRKYDESQRMKHNAIVWERPWLWYVIAVLGFTMFGGAVATGQFSAFYTPLVLVTGVAALVFGVYLKRNKDA